MHSKQQKQMSYEKLLIHEDGNNELSGNLQRIPELEEEHEQYTVTVGSAGEREPGQRRSGPRAGS